MRNNQICRKNICRWTPDRPEKNRAGVWGAQPPSGFGFRDLSRRPGPGPPALPGTTRPKSNKYFLQILEI